MTTEYTARQLEEIEHHTRYEWPLESWVIDDSVLPRKYQEYLDVIDQYYPGDKGLQGMRVLDCGCGFGVISVALAQRGAQIQAFDISGHMVEIAQRLARENQLQDSISVQVSGFENLNYPSESFDLVTGTAVLHHVDIDAASSIIGRSLKPGGRAVFYEPVVLNGPRETLRKFYRRFLPFLIQGTSEEHPLTSEEMNLLATRVGRVKMHSCFFSPLVLVASKLFPGKLFRRAQPMLEKTDTMIDRQLPSLRRFESHRTLVFDRVAESEAAAKSAV